MASPSSDAGSGRLYLIPTPLGPGEPAATLPGQTRDIIVRLQHFIAEDLRSARRFLTQFALSAPIQTLWLRELSEHTAASSYDALLQPLSEGYDVGVLSEAGCPVVADPGAGLVALAQDRGITVVPLVGPSAPLLALMASGCTGQSFRFHGYLPVEPAQRAARLQALERESARDGCTQLFIETPYRNRQMFAALLEACRPDTRLAVAADLTLPSESVVSHPIDAWRRLPAPELDRRPAVFVFLAAPASAPGRPRRR